MSFCCRKVGAPLPKEIEKFNSHKQMIIGFVKADEPGDYILRFDNTYSWTRAKSVHYRVFIDAEELPLPVPE